MSYVTTETTHMIDDNCSQPCQLWFKSTLLNVINNIVPVDIVKFNAISLQKRVYALIS